MKITVVKVKASTHGVCKHSVQTRHVAPTIR